MSFEHIQKALLLLNFNFSQLSISFTKYSLTAADRKWSNVVIHFLLTKSQLSEFPHCWPILDNDHQRSFDKIVTTVLKDLEVKGFLSIGSSRFSALNSSKVLSVIAELALHVIWTLLPTKNPAKNLPLPRSFSSLPTPFKNSALKACKVHTHLFVSSIKSNLIEVQNNFDRLSNSASVLIETFRNTQRNELKLNRLLKEGNQNLIDFDLPLLKSFLSKLTDSINQGLSVSLPPNSPVLLVDSLNNQFLNTREIFRNSSTSTTISDFFVDFCLSIQRLCNTQIVPGSVFISNNSTDISVINLFNQKVGQLLSFIKNNLNGFQNLIPVHQKRLDRLLLTVDHVINSINFKVINLPILSTPKASRIFSIFSAPNFQDSPIKIDSVTSSSPLFDRSLTFVEKKMDYPLSIEKVDDDFVDDDIEQINHSLNFDSLDTPIICQDESTDLDLSPNFSENFDPKNSDQNDSPFKLQNLKNSPEIFDSDDELDDLFDGFSKIDIKTPLAFKPKFIPRNDFELVISDDDD
ncbi:hypothetical protein RCL1_005611 [Eukaryota sp. TZLM3-RCL]